MKRNVILAVLGVIILAFVAIAATRHQQPAVTAQPEPASFTDCATMYPVINGNPRTCVSPAGTVFTESAVAPVVSTSTTTTTTTTTPGSSVKVTSTSANQKVASPLTVTGSARGSWYFEASFPVELRNAANQVIANGPAQAQGDWMTTNFVPFKASLTFPVQPAGSHGTLVLKKDNPSGDPAKDQSVSIPVTF